MSVKAFVFCSIAVLVTAAGRAVEFDCIQIPMNPEQKPDECITNPDPTGWCSCLTMGLTTYDAEKFATLEQAIIFVVDESTIGKHLISVLDGTLDLSGVGEGDSIGQFVIDVPAGGPENFYILFDMIATGPGPEEDSVAFDIKVIDTNDFSKDVLTYNPMDDEHAQGLTYRGTVKSFGGRMGFEMVFEYIVDTTQLPIGTSTGIEYGDLYAPNFSVPAMLMFPTIDIFKLPPGGSTVDVETTMYQIDPDPTDQLPPIEKMFSDSFEIQGTIPKEEFRRSDANGSGVVDLSDPIMVLGYLFLGDPAPACLDSADADDSGKLDLSDAIYALTWLFLGGPEPLPPGPKNCGTDVKPDDLAACTYKC